MGMDHITAVGGGLPRESSDSQANEAVPERISSGYRRASRKKHLPKHFILVSENVHRRR